METKKCPKCQDDKKVSEFYKNKSRKDGLAFSCKSCEAIKKTEHYLTYKDEYIRRAKGSDARRRKWFKEYKKSLKCNRCGEDHPACMQFHHIDPNQKDGTISQMTSRWGVEKLLNEIAKCEVLCANCHSKEHWSE